MIFANAKSRTTNTKLVTAYARPASNQSTKVLLMLIQTIKAAQLTARKLKSPSTQTLTTLYSEALVPGKNNGNRESTDSEVTAVIKKFIKNAKDSIESLQGSHNYDNCQHRIDDLQTEIEVLSQFLPIQLTEQEIITEISNLKITLNSDFNIKNVMSYFNTNFKDRFDSKLVATLTSKA